MRNITKFLSYLAFSVCTKVITATKSPLCMMHNDVFEFMVDPNFHYLLWNKHTHIQWHRFSVAEKLKNAIIGLKAPSILKCNWVSVTTDHHLCIQHTTYITPDVSLLFTKIDGHIMEERNFNCIEVMLNLILFFIAQ